MLQSLYLPLIAIVAGLVATVGIANASTAEDFFRYREISDAQLSPDGKYLTTLVGTVKNPGVRNLEVIDLATGESKAITFIIAGRVIWYYWADEDRIVFEYTRGRNRIWYQKFYLVVYSTSRHETLSQISYSTGLSNSNCRLSCFDRVLYHENHIVFQRGPRHNSVFPDVYRVNIGSGKERKIVEGRSNLLNWVADNNGVVRAGISAGADTKDLNYELIYRSDEKSPWRRLYEFYDDAVVVFGFDETNSRLFVAAQLAGGRYKLYAMDPESGQLGEPILEDPDYDIYYEYSNTPHLVSTDQGKPVYFEYMRDRPRRKFFDAKWQMRQKKIDQALPGAENRMVDWDSDETRFLIFRHSDRDEGSYYLYDEKEQTIKFLFAISPWLDSDNLARTEPFEYEARDGLKLHGFITRKTGDSDGPAPTIILPHGGPWGIRDQWEFDQEVQYLASLGYTVIQPNYRGSGGYGYQFEISSYRQLGLQMQDDVTDATHWAIENKMADPQRICIYGTGFGGYAALMGVAREPGLYACAVSIAGVYDLKWLAKYRVRSGGGKRKRTRAWREAFGDHKKDAERLRNTSPVNLVSQIKAPVFIIHQHIQAAPSPANLGPKLTRPTVGFGGLAGNKPLVVPHSRTIKQLKRQGKEYRYLTHEENFFAEQNVIDRYKEIGDFLGTYLDQKK